MNKISFKYLPIIISLILSLFIFSSKPSYSSEVPVLLAMKLECGANKAGKKPFSDYFFAITTDYIFQGNRYWNGSGKYEGDIGQKILNGERTNKSLLIKGEGKWLKKKDKWKLQFVSKGNKSMFEHLEAGVEGYEGEGKHRRECVLKLLNQVNADDAIQLNSYVKKIAKQKDEINKLKNQTVENSSNKQTILKSTTEEDEIKSLTDEFNKQIDLLESQISRLKKETEINDNKIIELTNQIASNNNNFDYKNKFEKLLLEFQKLNNKLEISNNENLQLEQEILSLLDNDKSRDKKNDSEKKFVNKENKLKEKINNQTFQTNETPKIEYFKNNFPVTINLLRQKYEEGCGKASIEYIFKKDFDYQLTYICPIYPDETPYVHVGRWNDISDNLNSFKTIQTKYIFDGIEYSDTILLGKYFTDIKWNNNDPVGYINKKINDQDINLNLDNKTNDFSGRAIQCFMPRETSYYDVNISLQFINKNDVRFSLLSTFREDDGTYDPVHFVQNEIIKYEQNSDKIILKTGELTTMHDFHGIWEKIINEVEGDTDIYRDNLDIDGYFRTTDNVRCRLVDFEKSDLFNIFDKFKKKINEPEKEKNNLL